MSFQTPHITSNPSHLTTGNRLTHYESIMEPAILAMIQNDAWQSAILKSKCENTTSTLSKLNETINNGTIPEKLSKSVKTLLGNIESLEIRASLLSNILGNEVLILTEKIESIKLKISEMPKEITAKLCEIGTPLYIDPTINCNPNIKLSLPLEDYLDYFRLKTNESFITQTVKKIQDKKIKESKRIQNQTPIYHEMPTSNEDLLLKRIETLEKQIKNLSINQTKKSKPSKPSNQKQQIKTGKVRAGQPKSSTLSSKNNPRDTKSTGDINKRNSKKRKR